MHKKWAGVLPAATTEFESDGTLSLEATSRHLQIMIDAGIHGVVMLGTVGENTSLEYNEKLDVIRAALDVCRGRIPVLTGVAEYTTDLACRFARDAERVGVDGLMVLPAMVYKSDARETMMHFRAVARATALPVLCYNNPVSYGVDITPEMFAQMADEPNLAAIKESSDDVRRITDLKNLTGDRYVLFEGVDDLALEGALLGASGWISGLVNSFPREAVMLWDLATSGQVSKALGIYRWFTPLLHLDTKPKLVQYIKFASAMAGTGAEHVRAPRLILEGAEREAIADIVRRALENRPALAEVAARR
ncbi:MAG TPA: dihydrodipicolinate synthase family protein [Bryobacteraceae bacterium]|nr:dihydrodipicolinate synthase family protein [Bryobacteraceae bacterium]